MYIIYNIGLMMHMNLHTICTCKSMAVILGRCKAYNVVMLVLTVAEMVDTVQCAIPSSVMQNACQ